MQNDTICAVSTASGMGAIAIIRISGVQAIDISDSIFSSVKKDFSLKSAKGYSVHYGNIVNDNNYYSLLFLGREFDRVFKFEKNTMGNNCSIVSAKCALSLLLIYFYDGADMMPGIRAMCLKAVENIDFKPDKYFFLNLLYDLIL